MMDGAEAIWAVHLLCAARRFGAVHCTGSLRSPLASLFGRMQRLRCTAAAVTLLVAPHLPFFAQLCKLSTPWQCHFSTTCAIHLFAADQIVSEGALDPGSVEQLSGIVTCNTYKTAVPLLRFGTFG